MTWEQMERAMAFVLEGQAQFTTDIAELTNAVAELRGAMAELRGTVQDLAGGFAETTTAIAELTEVAAQHDRALRVLVEEQRTTGEQVRSLAAPVDRWIARDGHA